MTQATSIRAFIGSKDYQRSRAFYRQLGFEEIVVGEKMCLFKVSDQLSFYLRDYYVKDWVDNSMILLSVTDLAYWEKRLLDSGVTEDFPEIRITKPQVFEHGTEIFLHDPAGVLWHFCAFRT